MTAALCLNCGGIKFGALCACDKCGCGPTDNHEVDILFSDHRFSEQVLQDFGRIIRQLKTVAPDPQVRAWAFMQYMSDNYPKTLYIKPPSEYTDKVKEVLSLINLPRVEINRKSDQKGSSPLIAGSSASDQASGRVLRRRRSGSPGRVLESGPESATLGEHAGARRASQKGSSTAMECPKCKKSWPDGVKFCGSCGARLSSAASARSPVEEQVGSKVRQLLAQIGFGKILEPSPGVFIIPKGSTHVEVRTVSLPSGQVVIRSRAPVTTGTPISQELLEFLLKENASLLFGAFGITEKDEIIYSHTIMASSVDATELGASVSAVVNMADKYDDEIVNRWGGKTAKQAALDVLIPAVLLKSIRAKQAAGIRVQAVVKPTPAPKRQSMTQSADALKVGSVAEEYAYLAQQRCSCGGPYKRDSQALLEKDGGYFDQIEASCVLCGAQKRFLFDINSFLGKGV